MHHLLTVAASALLGAVAFGMLGALFGGAVRVMAYFRDQLPDRTVGAALRNGVRGGAGFLAVIGGLFGVLVAILEPTAEDRMTVLRDAVGTVGTLMLWIGIGIAVPSTILVWPILRAHRRRVVARRDAGADRADR